MYGVLTIDLFAHSRSVPPVVSFVFHTSTQMPEPERHTPYFVTPLATPEFSCRLYHAASSVSGRPMYPPEEHGRYRHCVARLHRGAAVGPASASFNAPHIEIHSLSGVRLEVLAYTYLRLLHGA